MVNLVINNNLATQELKKNEIANKFRKILTKNWKDRNIRIALLGANST